MEYSVEVDRHHIIRVSFLGDQNYDSVLRAVTEMKRFARHLREEDRNVLVLIDISFLTSASDGARKVGVDTVKFMKYDRMAVFGGSNLMRQMANLVLKIAGKHEKARYFESREPALAWLHS